MTTLIKIIIASILSLSLFSCNFDIAFNTGRKGNGNVTTTNRPITAAFQTIKATEGLNVILTQSDNESITVEADDNLQDLIITEIDNDVLKLHTKSLIGRATAKNVRVNFTKINNITSTSGSDVSSTNTITLDSLHIKSTSGSDLNLKVNTKVLNCRATSGSDIILEGETTKLNVEATSGSDIKAADLMAEITNARATSGADITVNTSKELTARATSGGDVRYYGNPKNVEKSDSSSGSIKKQ